MGFDGDTEIDSKPISNPNQKGIGTPPLKPWCRECNEDNNQSITIR